MGLLQNIGLLNAEPTSYVGGAAISCIDLAHFNRNGTELNFYFSIAGMDQKGGVPYGYSPPNQFIMPIKNGGMSSAPALVNGTGTITSGLTKGGNIASGAPRIRGLGGLTANTFLGYYCLADLSGSGEITIASLSGAVRFIANLLGEGTLEANQSILAWSAALLEGISSLEGEMDLPIGLAVDLIGGGEITNATMVGLAILLAGLSGDGTLEADFRAMAQLTGGLSGDGDLVNPVLKAIAWCLANLVGAGEVESSLRGDSFMEANITSAGELVTAQSCAVAVWNALASAYNESGTMGARLNDAGSASNPWAETLPGSYISGQAGYIIGTFIDKAISAITDIGESGHEVTGIPGPTTSLEEKLIWLYEYFSGKRVVTKTLETLFKSDGSVLGTSAIQKDDTTITKNAMS
jgi:hypothetical protein